MTDASGGVGWGGGVVKVQLLRVQPVGSDVRRRARAEATSAATWSQREAPLDGRGDACTGGTGGDATLIKKIKKKHNFFWSVKRKIFFFFFC